MDIYRKSDKSSYQLDFWEHLPSLSLERQTSMCSALCLWFPPDGSSVKHSVSCRCSKEYYQLQASLSSANPTDETSPECTLYGRHPPAKASGDWVSDYQLILECIDSLHARNIWISHNLICLQLNCRGTAHCPGCFCTAVSVCLGNI